MTSSTFSTVNPATGEQIETFSFFTPQETETKLACADQSFRFYRKVSVEKRAELLASFAQALRKDKTLLSNSSPRKWGRFSLKRGRSRKTALEAEWYAEHGPQMFADEPASTGGSAEAYVSYLPLGAIIAVMPWNLTIWQVARMAIPTLLAGNVVLVKHSPNTQRCSLEMERVLPEAGFQKAPSKISGFQSEA